MGRPRGDAGTQRSYVGDRTMVVGVSKTHPRKTLFGRVDVLGKPEIDVPLDDLAGYDRGKTPSLGSKSLSM